jgi:hypothetical protein
VDGQVDYYVDGSFLTSVTTPEIAQRLNRIPPG